MTSNRIHEIANQLPGSWEELKVKDYYKLLNLKVIEQDEFDDLFVGIDNTYSIIQCLSDATTEELDAIAQMSPIEARKVFDKVLFMHTQLPDDKRPASFPVKGIDEITYNDYVLYTMFFKEPATNLHRFIKVFSKVPMTEEEAMNASVADAWSVFFFQVRSVQKYSKNLKSSLTWKQRKEKMKNLLMKTPFKQISKAKQLK